VGSGGKGGDYFKELPITIYAEIFEGKYLHTLKTL